MLRRMVQLFPKWRVGTCVLKQESMPTSREERSSGVWNEVEINKGGGSSEELLPLDKLFPG